MFTAPMTCKNRSVFVLSTLANEKKIEFFPEIHPIAFAVPFLRTLSTKIGSEHPFLKPFNIVNSLFLTTEFATLVQAESPW